MARNSGIVEEGSFHIEQEVLIRAARPAVWTSLLDVHGWWCHRFAEKGSRLVLEPFPGGRFFEDSPEGAQALFGTVIYLKAPACIRLSGPLGMNRLPVTSTYEWALDERPDGHTTLRLSHRAIGLIDPEWQASHEEGWKKLWTHLQALAERGTPYQPA